MYDHPHTAAQRRLLDEVDANVERPDEPAKPITTGQGQGAGTDSADTGALAAGGDKAAVAPDATGAVSHERVAAPGDVSAAALTPREARLREAADHHFSQLPNEIGWDQVGGQIIRAADAEDHEYATRTVGGQVYGSGQVIGRTKWVGKPGPMGIGESALWRGRPDPINEKQAHEAFRKANAGEKLTAREQRFIDHARRLARLYAEDDEQENEAFAKQHGFDSIDAMHAHDAVNLVGQHDDAVPAGKEDIPFGDTGPAPDYGDEVPFSRAPARPGMSRAALAGTIHDIVRGWHGDAPRVQVHQSHADATIPPSIRNARGFGRDIEGAYDPNTRTVHLFADALKSPYRALQVLAHEVIGHYGLEQLVGKDWGKLVADINGLRGNIPKSLQSVFDEVNRRYPGADANTFASEFMAVLAEHGINNTFTDRAFAAIRRFLRSMGLNVRISDAELRQMLVAAKRRAEGERGVVAGHPQTAARLAFATNPEDRDVRVANVSGDEFGKQGKHTDAMRENAKQWARANLQGKQFHNDEQGWNVQVGAPRANVM